MNQFVTSFDGTSIHFQHSGQGETALIFAHGWLGNSTWWNQQRDALKNQFQIVQIDLAGHGKSSRDRREWSVRAYAEDIKAVIDTLRLQKVILIGHSMSGSNIVEAYHLIPDRVSMLILVDTFQDLEEFPSMEQAAPLFESMRKDFKRTAQIILPQYLFSNTSPRIVVEQLTQEFVSASPEIAIASLEPFYTTEMRQKCSQVRVPVRAINGDLYPTNLRSNQKYFSDFSFEIISGVGHYPMLENPLEFNQALEKTLRIS